MRYLADCLPSNRGPVRDAASLLHGQELKCVGYLYAKSSSYLARNCVKSGAAIVPPHWTKAWVVS